MVQSSFELEIFCLREVIKNAGILSYVCIFLRTISGKYQAKTDLSLRSTAVFTRGLFFEHDCEQGYELNFDNTFDNTFDYTFEHIK